MKTILAIDDDGDLLRLMKIALEHQGYQVVTAHNGQEGLARLGEQRPDLVLCDMVMPIMNGEAVYLAIQDNPDLRNIPMILVTSAEYAAMRECENALLLRKPFEIEALLKIVDSIIDGI